MNVTELPKFGQPRIANGTFIIFSFDPAAYASAIDPEDEIVSAAARRITRKKYLGLVEGLGPIDLPRLRQNLDIRVVGLAPPQEGEDDVYPTNPTRCVPVSPTANHAEGRVPLTTSAPLPWPECYVHTLVLVNAFVSRVHHANPTNATVDKEEMERLASLVAHDQCAARDEALALESDHESDGGSCHSSESGDDEYDSESEASECFDPDTLAPSHPFMEIWEDLTVATTLGEPKDVGADIDEIMDIGEEWGNRKKLERWENSPKTLQWAAQLAEISPEDFVPDGTEATVPVDDTCDDLRPEDAVDERQQPERDVEQPQARSNPDSATSTQVSDLQVPNKLSVESTPRAACLDGEGSSLFIVIRRWIQLVLRL